MWRRQRNIYTFIDVYDLFLDGMERPTPYHQAPPAGTELQSPNAARYDSASPETRDDYISCVATETEIR